MQRYFGPQGLLAQKVKSFDFRASQLEMAQGVFECLGSEVPLLVEAGTGTGKTWAYLIPAILSGKKVVVSTGTKTLQDQILDHDIPFLKRLLSPNLHAVCLKGRRNYLCRRRFRDFSYQPTLWSKEEARLFKRFQNWAVRTQSGDRAEIDWLPDSFQTWNEVSSGSEDCLGQQCEDYSRCFITRLRLEASRAHLLVVNHHLFFADLALRGKGPGEVLPDYDAVIFDEAHQLEDTIGLYFGLQFSNLKINDLVHGLLKETRKDVKKIEKFQEMNRIVQQLDILGRLLYQHLSPSPGAQGRFLLDLQTVGKSFVSTCRELLHALEQLNALLTPAGESPDSLEPFFKRTHEMALEVRGILEQSDPSLVYWYELTPKAVFIYGTPIDVASVFRERLLSRKSSVVLTSATLSIAGSFDFIKNSLGMPPETRELLLPSPFAYEKQAILYIPSLFPAPYEPGFCADLAEEALKILTKTEGRALFLFTSYRNMRETHQLLKGRLPYPLLVQGQKPKRILLAEFKEKIHSILFATSSFWQGIDVPGEALSCLLIDKLPFEVPDDPLIAARMEHLSSMGKSSFFHYQVPRAVIQLKQGVGRLIRSSCDRGIIAIFDVRLLTKNYGRIFIKSLPPCKLVHSLEEIDRSFLISKGVSEDSVCGGNKDISEPSVC
ncbi:MAG: ATP-dependent DNA helicase [Deltaproteobacteria bacterium]|nr:ATP-dependent DNA helicase [Deltaproteobacteria bacterium]